MVMVTNRAGDMVIDFFKSVLYPLLHGCLPLAHQLLLEDWSDSRRYEDSETGPPTENYAGQWWPREGVIQGDHQAPALLQLTDVPAQSYGSPHTQLRAFWHWWMQTAILKDEGDSAADTSTPTQDTHRHRAGPVGEKLQLSAVHRELIVIHTCELFPYRNNHAWNFLLLFWHFSLLAFLKECTLSGKIPGWNVLIIPQVVLCSCCFCCLYKI